MPRSQFKRRQAQPHRKIVPITIRLIDQIDLPLSPPVLELLFAGNRIHHVAKHLEMDEAIDPVTRGKSRRRIIAMLPQPAQQIRCDANIQRAIVTARENIDARVAILPHGPERGAKWTLKQVQGDENGLDLDISRQTPFPHQSRHAELVSASIVPQARSVSGKRTMQQAMDARLTLKAAVR